MSKVTKDTKWFNDGTKNYRLRIDDSRIENLIPGKIERTAAQKAETFEKLSERAKGKKRYNDGVKNYSLYPEDPRTEGLIPGMLRR